jgi:hypothetical protein
MDREAHAVWLFKELDPKWNYIVPLRQSVTGPNAKFEELGDWEPYKEEGDQVQDGFLWLNDSRKGEAALRVRVVGRRRHRTGNVAYYATNTEKESFGASTVIDAYFHRWPAQEHVYRDGNGRVGLNVHHGFGRRQVQNVAIVDRMEQIEGQIRRNMVAMEEAVEQANQQDEMNRRHSDMAAKIEARMADLKVSVDEAVDTGKFKSRRFRENHFSMDVYREWQADLRKKADEAVVYRDAFLEKKEAAAAAIERAKAEAEHRASQTRVFTIDVELDQIMTAFKLTFMNLCFYLMAHYLGGKKVEIDTLIRAVLTLPGERVRTTSTETIRIFRQPRDREFMPLVEEACRLLTQKRLHRNNRRLIYEMVDPPVG